MPAFPISVHHLTPIVTVLNNRGHFAREILYHRHPDTPNVTDERITRHQYDARGQLVSSIDPRLYDTMQQSGAKVKPNFHYHPALSGDVLKTESVDAGTTCLLKDALGRPAMSQNAEGVITHWHYEPEGAGRLLYVSEKAPGGKKISQRALCMLKTLLRTEHIILLAIVLPTMTPQASPVRNRYP